MAEELFLGVVDRRGAIYIPWRGTTIFPDPLWSDYPGQNVLVTLKMNDAGAGIFVKAELPTKQQLVNIKKELLDDWNMLGERFRTMNMGQQVRVLQSINRAMAVELP